MKLPNSLQGRLLALVIGLVTSTWIIIAAVTWLDASHELDELLDGHLAQAAALLVAQQMREIEDDDRREDRAIDAPTLHRYAPKVAFQVFHEGQLVLQSSNAPPTPMVAVGEGFQTGFKTVQIGGIAWRMFAAYGAERDVQVYVGEQEESRAAILWAVLRSMLWPTGLAIPLLALVTWWAVNSGLAPLRALGRTLLARKAQALDAVVVHDAPSEMLPMLDALNGLFARITALMDAERRFTADAAHELRTPIAAIRVQAQVALGESDDAGRSRALNATLAGCDRASHVIEQLLILARLEAGAVPPATRLDLSTVAQRVTAELAPHALHKRQKITLDAEAQSVVAGDETLLAVLLRNLLDNAIRYSPNDAIIQITVTAHTQVVQLSIEDSGPGMAEPDRQRIGERFFRATGGTESGSGLGWSIVQRIATLHRARIHTGRSSKLGGLLVEVQFAATPLLS
jgi:two-component system sensor histidine kinase QseC